MKRNGQYVGVDEKYIPEEEKYVDNSTNEEIKNDINNGIKKNGKKVLKGFTIGYLALFGVIALISIIIIVVTIIFMGKIINKTEDTYDKTEEVYDNANSVIDDVMDQYYNNN